MFSALRPYLEALLPNTSTRPPPPSCRSPENFTEGSYLTFDGGGGLEPFGPAVLM